MIRKFVLPALAAALLAGCVTGDYAYRGGDRGDYYYGRPSVDYRYHDPYGGYGGYAPYGHGPYGYGRFGFGYGGYGYPHGHYGYPYGYGGYYNQPYYRPYYRRPPLTSPRPDGDAGSHPRRDDRRPPWRNFDELRRGQPADGGGAARAIVPSAPAVAPRERGSRMEQTIRRANRSASGRTVEQER